SEASTAARNRSASLRHPVGTSKGAARRANSGPLRSLSASTLTTPDYFRATLQGYFLPASLLGMCGYWLVGLWTPAVTRYYLWSLPVVLATILLGRALNQRMPVGSFLRYVHVGLLLVGI